MTTFAFLLLLGLELKHYCADFLLQFRWMIAGKGSLRRIGGYAHAGIHGAGTLGLLLALAVPLLIALGLAAAEVVIHYAIDYTKANVAEDISADERPHLFWAFYGLDQLLHHLTYLALVYATVALL